MKLLLCDAYIITNHVRNHEMSLSEYKEKLENPSGNLLEQYRLKLCNAIQNIASFQPKELLKSNFNPNLLPDTKTTRDTGNLTLFKCLICGTLCRCSKILYAHQREEHGENLTMQLKQHIMNARYHKCIICNKSVLCDNYLVGGHVYTFHKMRLNEYIKKIVIRNGHRNFPTFRAYKENQGVFETMEFSTDQNKKPEVDSGFILPEELSSESDDSDAEN